VNSLDRYLGVLAGEQVDFLPRTPILMQLAAEYIGSTYAEFASDFRVLVKANSQCATDFCFDQLSCISDPYRETHGFGGEIEYPESGPPRSSHPLLNHKDISGLLTPNPYKSERMLDRVQAVRAYQNQFGGKFSIMGWIEGPAAEAANLFGPTNFLMDFIQDKEFVTDLMDLCVDVGIEFASAQIDAGADTIGIGDAIASQVSPAHYEALILPREKRLISAIKEMGAYVKLHICGDITHLLPGIAALEVDIVDVDHMVNMATVRDALGDRVVLSGNIDPLKVASISEPVVIHDAVREVYAQVGNPFMVNAGCEIPSGTPVANLKALCQPIAYQR
jgi:MtaA/CmuA family methyltransferase